MIFNCEPNSVQDEIPIFLKSEEYDIYSDNPDLSIYVARLESHHRKHVSIYESLLQPQFAQGANILSIGEGTGEFIVSLALKYPKVNFYAFDNNLNRMMIASRLSKHYAVTNLQLFVSSVCMIPFPNDFFAGVIERGVFHTIPDDKKIENLREIERICVGPVVMGHMHISSKYYLAKRWVQSKVKRLPHVFRDAKMTYEAISSETNSIWRLKKLIQDTTGNRPKILYYFKGESEQTTPSVRNLLSFPTLAGLYYRTRQNA